MIKTVKLEVDGLTLSAIQQGLQMGILHLQTAFAEIQTQTQAQITADLLATQPPTPATDESNAKLS